MSNIEKELRRMENISREEEVLKIYKMLDPRPKELLLSQRKYVKGGPIQTWNPQENRKKPRVLFLFNDVLLIGKREGKAQYWLKTYIRLRGEIKLDDVPPKSGQKNVSFRLVSPKKSFLFFAPSEAKKVEWMAEIQRCIDGYYDPSREVVSTETTIEIERTIEAPVQREVVEVEKRVETHTISFGAAVDVDDLLDAYDDDEQILNDVGSIRLGDDDSDDDGEGYVTISAGAPPEGDDYVVDPESVDDAQQTAE